MPAATDVIHFADAWRANEFRERFNQIKAMDVVAHLFALIAEDTVWSAAHCTDHKVGKKAMQFRSSVRGPGEATGTERNCGHSKVLPVFLDENVRSDLRRAKERMLRVINAHHLGNAGARIHEPARFPSVSPI